MSNRREQKIKQLRMELRDLNRSYEKSNEIEKLGIACLTDSIRDELRRTRRAEQLKNSNKKKAKNRANFIKNPYNYTKTLLGGERTGHLHCNEEIEVPLGYCPRVEEEQQPTVDFETKEPTWKEVSEVCSKPTNTRGNDQKEEFGSCMVRPGKYIQISTPQIDREGNGSLQRLTVDVDNKTTAWQKLEKGIVKGCTISRILFIMSMNIIMNAAERETRGPKTDSRFFLPAKRGFMDDLTVTSSSHIQARWILLALEEVVTWARMKFKPKKSRSMILRKGQITTKFQLKIQGEEIPTIVDNPIKCLGKWFDDTLKDNSNMKTVQTQIAEWLKKADKSRLPGKLKA
ncbi:unnamed protein product [Mytilus coruscus]|uniref:Reverse transcriptase domain-containing protein n=1 Tax=Mytilus coruscus TaxID=42192 RepID=A0A6J8D8C8_MYTCO|nr:unnamed protein product [Mytilus coruscus]